MTALESAFAEDGFALSADLIQRAREAAKRSDRPTIEVLEELAGLDPDAFANALAQTLRYPALSMEGLHRLRPAFEMLAFTECLQHQCAPLRSEDQRLIIAFADPFAADIQDWVAERIHSSFSWALTARGDLTAYLARHEETMRAMDLVSSTAPELQHLGHRVEDISYKAIAQDSSPVVKLVHSTLYDALKSEVSDVHLETGPTGLTIKYRIDGVLTTVGRPSGIELAEQVISRVKVMAELDIAERRVPQDGRFKITIQGREVDFRVSIMPSIYGEDAVLRILDKQSLADHAHGLRLEQLGFEGTILVKLRRLAGDPYGMVLVTGPTGSGKTTTLYAMISEINHGYDKIITIEDPVEYQLPGVLQVPVNEKKGITFARGLRSILRHDPDKIMVGEIRDPETAQIAVQSALTGHLVFTTVHANNAFDVIGRMMHMGLDTYSFVSAINGILAQRLVRINCPLCSTPDQPDSEILDASGVSGAEAGYDFKRGRGCAHCRGSGYRGRKAVAELLILNDELREMINAREPMRHLKEAARRHGATYLREAALELVRRGETTLQEINRVTFVA